MEMKSGEQWTQALLLHFCTVLHAHATSLCACLAGWIMCGMLFALYQAFTTGFFASTHDLRRASARLAVPSALYTRFVACNTRPKAGQTRRILFHRHCASVYTVDASVSTIPTRFVNMLFAFGIRSLSQTIRGDTNYPTQAHQHNSTFHFEFLQRSGPLSTAWRGNSPNRTRFTQLPCQKNVCTAKECISRVAEPVSAFNPLPDKPTVKVKKNWNGSRNWVQRLHLLS